MSTLTTLTTKALPNLLPTSLREVAPADDDLGLRVASFAGCAPTASAPGCTCRVDAGYDAARTPWNLTDQRPAAVAVPRDAAEVAAVVRAAAAAGLRVAPQSTGHNAGPLAATGLADVVLVRTTALQEVVVDAARRRCRVGGGVEWQAAVEAVAPHGLACLHGSSPNVGVAGYSLGGGIGWYARKLGLATSHLTAVEVVLADGRIVRADAEHHAELFWAVRGGGGNFGVVTALEFELFEIPTAYAGMMIFDAARTTGGPDPLVGLGGRRAGRGDHVLPRDAPPAAAGAAHRSCRAAPSSSSTGPSSPTTSAPRRSSRRCATCSPRSTPSPPSRPPR